MFNFHVFQTKTSGFFKMFFLQYFFIKVANTVLRASLLNLFLLLSFICQLFVAPTGALGKALRC